MAKSKQHWYVGEIIRFSKKNYEVISATYERHWALRGEGKEHWCYELKKLYGDGSVSSKTAFVPRKYEVIQMSEERIWNL
jgi:hypothetical protein